jgi:hypothetical protein
MNEIERKATEVQLGVLKLQHLLLKSQLKGDLPGHPFRGGIATTTTAAVADWTVSGGGVAGLGEVISSGRTTRRINSIILSQSAIDASMACG